MGILTSYKMLIIKINTKLVIPKRPFIEKKFMLFTKINDK